MNDFYRGKAALPREARNSTSLSGSLEAWRDKRLLNVVKACEGTNNKFRINFGIIHQEYADDIESILSSNGNERELCVDLLEKMRNRFNMGCLAAMRGWIKEASGLCGAELEKILSLEIE